MIDFTQVIKNLEGKPLQVNGNAMTLKSVCIRALLLPENLKSEPSPDEKVKWFMLAQQIQQNDNLELSAKDKTLIWQVFLPKKWQ